VGPVVDRSWLTAILATSLFGFSLALFQVVQPLVTELVYDPEAWKQELSGFEGLLQSVAI